MNQQNQFGNNNWECSAWTQEDTDEFVGKLLVGPIIGIVLGLICTILASLPLCCGIMKAQGKIIAMVTIPLGILAALFPLFLSMNACGTFVENLCENCKDDQGNSCTESQEKELSDACHALGWLVAYLAAYGWAAVLLGCLGAGFGCCILCGCCAMKPDNTFVDGNQQTSA